MSKNYLKYFGLLSIACCAPILAQTETPLLAQPIVPEIEPPPRNWFIQVAPQLSPVPFSIGVGVRNRIEENLKGREHSIRFTPGISKELWGSVSYKYSRLTYQDSSLDANYSGIGFKVGTISHKLPFADIQFIKGWQYSSGPFKWGQLEINCLPIVAGVWGAGILMTSDSSISVIGAGLLGLGVATAISFNLAF